MKNLDQSLQRLNSTQSDSEIELGYLLAICLDHKLSIILITILFTVCGLIYAVLASPEYRADALLHVENRDNPLGTLDLALLGQDQAESSTQSEILRSRMILSRAAAQAGLDIVVRPRTLFFIGGALNRIGVQRPNFAEGWASVWAGESVLLDELYVDVSLLGQELTLTVLENGAYGLQGPEGQELGQGTIGERLIIEFPQIQILVGRIDAPRGAQFRLVKRSETAMTQYLQSRFRVAERGTDTSILELSLTGNEPEELVRSLDAITQVYVMQNINRQAAEAESSLRFLEEQTPQIQQDLTGAENQLNNYRASQESVDLSFETRSMLERLVELESEINALRMQETELAQRFTQSHPAYRTLQEQRVQLELERARVEEQAENLPETQRQVLRLTRDVEVTQQIYMQMLNTIQELRIARAGTIGNVRILDNALVAPDPIAPRRALIIIISLAAGLMLGLIIVLLRKMTNRGVENVDQLGEIGLAVYATIPLSDQQLTLVNEKIIEPARGKHVKGFHSLIRQSRQGAVAKGVLAWTHPTDLSIEALRSLRTSLHFAMLEASNKSLMLTGPSPAVGKSFVAVNLAAVCAQANQKVLLIDADMRKGHIHTAFKDSNENGLSDLLSGRAMLKSAVRQSQQQNLDYIPRGRVPPNPSELLMHENFSNLLYEVNKLYDLVIIDTPPILSVTDAAIVGKQTGTTLMVVRFQMNSPREIERATDQMLRSGVQVKGVILNAIERSAAASYGYGYGYGYYKYGSVGEP